MGLIKDEAGRDIVTDDAKPEAARPGSNGASAKPGRVDVRSLPTGTIIYNLIRVTGEEVGLENFIHGMEQQKAAQKLVGDPPQLAAAKQAYDQMVQSRFIFASVLNDRFKDVDAAYWARLGIEVTVLAGDEAPAPTTPAVAPEAD